MDQHLKTGSIFPLGSGRLLDFFRQDSDGLYHIDVLHAELNRKDVIKQTKSIDGEGRHVVHNEFDETPYPEYLEIVRQFIECGRKSVNSEELEAKYMWLGNYYNEKVKKSGAELRPFLEDAFALAGERGLDPAQPVIARYRGSNTNLRTQLTRIIKRAGIKPWPKRFQNLRASRATELAAEHPAHVAAAWLGHSTTVAVKHYGQITDADYARALESRTQSAALAVQSAAVPSGSERNGANDDAEIAEKRKMPSEFVTLKVGGTRLELVTSTV